MGITVKSFGKFQSNIRKMENRLEAGKKDSKDKTESEKSKKAF